MTRHRLWATVAAATAATVVTRLPFRSDFLFSWDSANYALAMSRIDIVAHRPHPPGYLGYVFAARVIDLILHDANASLVLWNIFVSAAVVGVITRMAWEVRPASRTTPVFVTAAVTVAATSPLLWFYGEVAEIYPSELLVTLLIGWTVWRSLAGKPHALSLCALALPIGAVFKLTAPLFMLPLAVYAWWHAGPIERRRSLAIAAAGSVLVLAVVLFISPRYPAMVWTQSSDARATSVAARGLAGAGERFNHNLRDTLTAAISIFGVVNFVALVVWTVVSRRLPDALGRTTAILWTAPWILLCVFVHIGKPGYLLPVLSVGTLILASFYARLPAALAWVLIATQAATNVAHFAVLQPFPPSLTGGDIPYRSKTLLQRLASDAQALTFPTASTIDENDAAAQRALAAVRRHCPRGDGVVVPDLDILDSRRTMFYLPRTTVIHVAGQTVMFTGIDGTFRAVPEGGTELLTPCPVIWFVKDGKSPPLPAAAHASREAGVGLVIDARRVVVTPAGVAFPR